MDLRKLFEMSGNGRTAYLVGGAVGCRLSGEKDTIYKNYTVDIRTTPYFVLVFDGLHDGIFSVESCGCAGRHRRERKAAVHPAAGGECL